MNDKKQGFAMTFFLLVISFQFTLGDDPSEMLGATVSRRPSIRRVRWLFSLEMPSQRYPQMDEAVYNLFPLFIVDWMNRTTLVLASCSLRFGS